MITVLVTTVTIFAQVVFRYVFSSPIYWADEFAVLVFAWMIFIGTVVATKYNEHLSVDTFIRMFPQRLQMVLTITTNVAILLVHRASFCRGHCADPKNGRAQLPGHGNIKGISIYFNPGDDTLNGDLPLANHHQGYSATCKKALKVSNDYHTINRAICLFCIEYTHFLFHDSYLCDLFDLKRGYSIDCRRPPGRSRDRQISSFMHTVFLSGWRVNECRWYYGETRTLFPIPCRAYPRWIGPCQCGFKYAFFRYIRLGGVRCVRFGNVRDRVNAPQRV